MPAPHLSKDNGSVTAGRSYRPTSPDLLRDSVPAELRAERQWVCWSERKVPYNPITGREASSTDPASWASFDEAVGAVDAGRFRGVGFVLTEGDPFVAVDLDDCRNPETGEVTADAQVVIDAIDSYAEVSPSGTGVHVWARGTLPAGGRKRGDVEMYETARYLTVTGDLLGERRGIEERTEQLAAVHLRVFGSPSAANPRSGTSSPALGDQEVLSRAFGAANGGKVHRLYSGDTGGYASPSEADAALLSMLAFYTQDADQLDRLFRQSGLYRDKWDRQDYRERTIRFALAKREETYQGRRQPIPTTGRVVTSFAEIDMRAIDWLWQDYVPLGKPTELLGDPGLGKSTIAFDLAARVSAGRPMPGGTPEVPLTDLAGPAGVLILSVEDDPEDTIKPRLVACGAEVDRIVTLRLRTDEGGLVQLTLPDDIEHIRAVVAECGVKLLIIDPVVAYLGDRTDAHRDKDVRRALAPLAEVAQEADAAILGIRHLNKNEDAKNVIYRGGGSIAFAAQSRSVLFVAAQEAEAGTRLPHALSVGKSNNAAMAATWLYEVEPVVVGRDERADGRVKEIVGTRIGWLGTSTATAQQLLGAQPGSGDTLGVLREFVAEMLKDGPVRATEMRAACEAAGIKWGTLNDKRYKDRLGIRSRQRFSADGEREWWWEWATQVAIVNRDQTTSEEDRSDDELDI